MEVFFRKTFHPIFFICLSELILGFVKKGSTPPPPPCVPKRGPTYKSNEYWCFSKKKTATNPSPLSPHLQKIEQGLSLGAGLFCSPPTTITLAFKSDGQRQREKSGRVSDLNTCINKWNQSTLFSRMIDFWKIDLFSKWHIPDATMVGRRQFNIPQKCPARPFVVWEYHDALKLFSLFSVGQQGTKVY